MATATTTVNPPRMTGKHPPGTNFGRPAAAAGSKTRPQQHNQLSANGAGGAASINSAKLAERRRAAQKPAELARTRGKQPNGVTEDADGDTIMVREARERATVKVCWNSCTVIRRDGGAYGAIVNVGACSEATSSTLR